MLVLVVASPQSLAIGGRNAIGSARGLCARPHTNIERKRCSYVCARVLRALLALPGRLLRLHAFLCATNRQWHQVR